MAVNSTVATLICKKYFRGFSYDENSRKYSFSLNSLSGNGLNQFAREICRSGNIVTASDVANFLNQTVNSKSFDEEWSAIESGLLMPGEVVCVGGDTPDGSFAECRLMKMNVDYFICWISKKSFSTGNQSVIKIGTVAIPEDFEFKIHSDFEIGGRHLSVSLIKIEHPGYFHRLLDSILLGPDYIESASHNILPLFNELAEMHRHREVCNNFSSVLQKVSQHGLSTHTLRRILNYICLDNA